jgi:gas vesicle protein
LFDAKEDDIMHNRDHYDKGAVVDATGWSAFLAGAFIGAGVALLCAPQAGTELRGILRDYANRAKDDLMEKGQEAVDTVVERGKEYYDQGKKIAGDAGRAAKELAQKGQEAVKDPGRSAKEFAKPVQGGGR